MSIVIFGITVIFQFIQGSIIFRPLTEFVKNFLKYSLFRFCKLYNVMLKTESEHLFSVIIRPFKAEIPSFYLAFRFIILPENYTLNIMLFKIITDTLKRPVRKFNYTFPIC